jgi:hypothetical protein
MPEIPAPNIEFQNERDEIKKQLSEVKRKKSEGILKNADLHYLRSSLTVFRIEYSKKLGKPYTKEVNNGIMTVDQQLYDDSALGNGLYTLAKNYEHQLVSLISRIKQSYTGTIEHSSDIPVPASEFAFIDTITTSLEAEIDKPFKLDVPKKEGLGQILRRKIGGLRQS